MSKAITVHATQNPWMASDTKQPPQQIQAG